MRSCKLLLWFAVLAAFVFGGVLGGSPALAAQEKPPLVGSVTLTAHPKSLEGKTVVLRWNSKLNGDKFLDRVAELLIQNVPKVKVIKMYQVDPSTAAVTANMAESLKVAAKIAERKPDLVIASQAD